MTISKDTFNPTEPPRRLWPMWIIALVVAALSFSMPILQCYHPQRQRRRAPRDLAEIAVRIEGKYPDWHIVPMSKGGSVDSGFWICDRERSWEELSRLTPAPEFRHEWAGVIEVMKSRFDYLSVNPGWHNLGSVAVFGDEAMIRALMDQ